MVRRVLLIAYHFPPIQGSSGVQRTLTFSQYLPDYEWEPIVLSIHSRAYPQVSDDQIAKIRKDIIVKRAFGLDTEKHLSIGGRYPRLLAYPDRWVAWWLGAVPAAISLIRTHKPSVIWTTYPIATAHLIGITVKRFTGISWVADFRDSMTEDTYPPDPSQRRVYRWIEQKTVKNSARTVFTTPGTLRLYSQRYPDIPRSRWSVIPNGFDEEAFRTAEHNGTARKKYSGSPLVLIHSGTLYPSERDPTSFFAAMSELVSTGKIDPDRLKVVLRASGSEEHYRQLIRDNCIENVVVLAPPVSYCEALKEMLGADGLLLFQAANCNHQIPAKLYEYLRAQRPILALTDPGGDTAAALIDAGVDTILPLDSKDKIRDGLQRFLELIRRGEAPIAPREIVMGHTRRARTAQLAALFDEVA